eukprot:TRINITY_DN5451_c0_g1_i6.p1 TRINITY_DN5451_c0_g1~~TRINITY_DN5451_c0_g1_i6.p1  ORF type:complete len:303 (+),score=66.69 TRINITY_DN5451_c0_g1_i6:230-1138(+)
MSIDTSDAKRRGKAEPEEDGWVRTDELQFENELPDQFESNDVQIDPGRPWPRESSLVLAQLAISLGILLVGDVLFAGYTLGIFEGLICWAVGLFGLIQNTRPSQKRRWLPCAPSEHDQKYYAMMQILCYGLAALGLASLGFLQIYYSHIHSGSEKCTILFTDVSGPTVTAINNTVIDSQCGFTDSGTQKALGDLVGCGGCLCVTTTSGTDSTCKYECMSSMVQDNVCGTQWRRHVAGEVCLVAFGLVAFSSAFSFMRLCHMGVVALIDRNQEQEAMQQQLQSGAEHVHHQDNQLQAPPLESF